MNRSLILPHVPERIVSLVPSLTETLFAIGAGPRLVGVTAYCNHPAEAQTRKNVGGVLDPHWDRICALCPDLVAVSKYENRLETVEALESEGIPVYVTAPTGVDSAVASMEGLASALGCGEAGSRLARNLRAGLASLPPIPDPIPVFFPIWENPLIAPGKGTYVADLLRRSGAVSIAETLGEGWPECDLPFLQTSKAAVILLPSEPYPFQEADRRRWLRETSIPAAAAGHVFRVDGELTNRPGPRLLEGIRAIRSLIEPI
ncbi:MAG: helical backbone metal receptor, partial [Planctomycetota bacterium]